MALVRRVQPADFLRCTAWVHRATPLGMGYPAWRGVGANHRWQAIAPLANPLAADDAKSQPSLSVLRRMNLARLLGYHAAMKNQHLETLRDLQAFFAFEEDWVGYGHVSYLLERLSEPDETGEELLCFWPVSFSVH